MSKGDGTGVGAGSLTVPAPIKPAYAVHEGAPADQPMNAATLALFAHVTKLESDIRAAREAEQDQAALHGRLWAELVAAEAKVEAVPVPIATPQGASAAMRRKMREAERSRLRRFISTPRTPRTPSPPALSPFAFGSCSLKSLPPLISTRVALLLYSAVARPAAFTSLPLVLAPALPCSRRCCGRLLCRSVSPLLPRSFQIPPLPHLLV